MLAEKVVWLCAGSFSPRFRNAPAPDEKNRLEAQKLIYSAQTLTFVPQRPINSRFPL